MSEILGTFQTLKVELKKDNLVVIIASRDQPREVMRGYLGHTVVPSGGCLKKKTDDTLFINWKDGNLRITHNLHDTNHHQYDFIWTTTKPSKLVDTFDMAGAHWYGGAQIRKMMWPLDKLRFKMAPFVAEDSYKDGEYGGVQERYWLSSNGVALFVHQAVPLSVGINESGDSLIRLQTKFDGPYRNSTKVPLTLRYSIFQGPSILETHKRVLSQKIDRPIGIPDEAMFRLPIWSTWAICKEDVDQSKVLSIANQILSYGIQTCQLEIDDDWAAHRGDWDFDRKKFPNPREMIRRLAEFGFRVTLWVHPFSNLKSKSIKRTDLFVKGMARGATKWWNGIGRVLDVTSPSAVEWYKKELNVLKENYGLTSFKFDAGETNWLPKKWVLNRECNNPNIYTQKWAELAYELDKEGRSQEVRVGVRSQKLPMFVRMMDKDSTWSEENGLRSIIPTALLYGIIGYPFFIPDMIGGNAYDERPTKQLFIRWVQACTLMPCMQFSFPPWWFDHQTVRITKAMLRLRAQYADLLIDLAKEATQTGEPIIRPLWWVADNDDFALKCDDQFLVGNDLLVAPVLVENVTKRPIYLPNGRWKDERSGQILDGKSWYFEYKVSIEDLPMFTRVKDEKKKEAVAIDGGVGDNNTGLVETKDNDEKANVSEEISDSLSKEDDIRDPETSDQNTLDQQTTDEDSVTANTEKYTEDSKEPDLIQWDNTDQEKDKSEQEPEAEQIQPADDVLHIDDVLGGGSILDAGAILEIADSTAVLQPEPSVGNDDQHVSVKSEAGSDENLPVVDDQANENTPGSKSVPIDAESATDDNTHSIGGGTLSEEDVPVASALSDDEETEGNTGGHLISLLRKSLITDPEADLSDAFASLVRGKYRFSHLDEDLDESQFMTDLSETASLASLDIVDDSDQTPEERSEETHLGKYPPLASPEISVDRPLSIPGIDPPETPFSPGFDLENTPTVPDPDTFEATDSGPDLDKPSSPEPDLQGPLSTPEPVSDKPPESLQSDLDNVIPVEGIPLSDEMGSLPNQPASTTDPALDCHIPAVEGDDISTKTKSLYENIHVPEEPSEPPVVSTKPQQTIPKRRPLPEPAPGKLTLWDELTAKLKDRPKFDPELDGEVAEMKTLGVQTSFDILGDEFKIDFDKQS